ncbi:hypothetical protein BH10ACT2_BH10ACT2_10840 [soil metagenome]
MKIKNDKAVRLARELSELTGESLTDVVVNSLEWRLAEERRFRRRPKSIDDLVDRFGQLPVLDERPADEIVGYHDDGSPR